jgi:DNA modification methylase
MYFGVDVSAKQIEANCHQWERAQHGVLGRVAYPPTWLHGDGEDIISLYRTALAAKGLPPDTPADFCCSCPPYWNLEEYDAGPKDLSMLGSYSEFCRKYARILAACASLLRPKHLAVMVVGNVRGKDGTIHHMLSDTLAAFKDAGCSPYNDAVLLTALGTAPARAGRMMSAASKLVPTHQNVLVVTKGKSFTPADARAIGVRAKEESQ